MPVTGLLSPIHVDVIYGHQHRDEKHNERQVSKNAMQLIHDSPSDPERQHKKHVHHVKHPHHAGHRPEHEL